jgi:hypothetical protein
MIYTRKARAREVGSCMGCNQYITARGLNDHAVVEIEFDAANSNQSTSIRLCQSCAKELLADNVLRRFAD